jgi:hypothetical protein
MDICDQAQSYRNLWAAVVNLAVDDYRAAVARISHKSRGKFDEIIRAIALREEPALWLISPELRPGSFSWCCELLDLPIDRVRKEVLGIEPAVFDAAWRCARREWLQRGLVLDGSWDDGQWMRDFHGRVLSFWQAAPYLSVDTCAAILSDEVRDRDLYLSGALRVAFVDSDVGSGPQNEMVLL